MDVAGVGRRQSGGMTLTDYLVTLALVLLIVRQLHGKRLTPVQLLWPLGLVGWAAVKYLHVVPTAGNDVALVAVCVTVGTVLGIGAGLTTRVRRGPDGVPVATATGLAVLLWVLGIGSRLAFGLYAENGGGPAIARFSTAHQITSAEAWVAALILMGLAEVVARTGVLALRGYRTIRGAGEAGDVVHRSPSRHLRTMMVDRDG